MGIGIPHRLCIAFCLFRAPSPAGCDFHADGPKVSPPRDCPGIGRPCGFAYHSDHLLRLHIGVVQRTVWCGCGGFCGGAPVCPEPGGSRYKAYTGYGILQDGHGTLSNHGLAGRDAPGTQQSLLGHRRAERIDYGPAHHSENRPHGNEYRGQKGLDPMDDSPGTPGAGIGALGRFGHGPGHICLAIAPSSRACCSPLLRRHPKGSKAGLSVCTNQHFGPHRSLVWEAMALEVSRRPCLSPKARLGVVHLFVQYRVDVAGASDATPFSGNEKSARSHIHSWSKP